MPAKRDADGEGPLYRNRAPEPTPGGVAAGRPGVAERASSACVVELAVSSRWATVRIASIAVTLIVVALFLAMALDPVVGAVQRRFHLGRGWSTGIVLAVATVLFAAFVVDRRAAAGHRVGEPRERSCPKTVDSLGDLPLVGRPVRDADLSEQAVRRSSSSLPEQGRGRAGTSPGRREDRSVRRRARAVLGVLPGRRRALRGPRADRATSAPPSPPCAGRRRRRSVASSTRCSPSTSPAACSSRCSTACGPRARRSSPASRSARCSGCGPRSRR